MKKPYLPRDARTEASATDRPGCRRPMGDTREAACCEIGGKRWLVVAAGLLWAPNDNEIPAGSNEVPAGDNEVPAANNEVPAGNNEVAVGTGGNERKV